MAEEQRQQEENEVMQRVEARSRYATNQRRLVLRALMGQHSWVTPRQLHSLLQEEQPGIGQATVYRTLELLVDTGAAARFVQENNESKYIYCPPRHHHHLVCTRCGLVKDVEACPLPAVGAALEKRTGFQINDHTITFFGYCADCRRTPNA